MNDLSGLSDDARQLFDLLPVDGTGAGNITLREILRMVTARDRYEAARRELFDAGVAVPAKGKGGSVRRVVAVDEPAVTASQATQAVIDNYRREAFMYEPMAAALPAWAAANRRDPCVVEIVAAQGRRATGGKWSRPDLVLVCVRHYEFVPTPFLHVVTFEVKLARTLDVTAVYEAVAHRRAATESVVLVANDVGDDLVNGDVFGAVRAEAVVHGVGLIVADDPCDADKWELFEQSQVVAADPEALDAFLQVQLSAQKRDELRQLLARPH